MSTHDLVSRIDDLGVMLDELDSKLNAVATREELTELREFIRESFAVLAAMIEARDRAYESRPLARTLSAAAPSCTASPCKGP